MASSARQTALFILRDVRLGRKSSSALDEHLERNPKDRAFISELVYGVLRWQGRLDGIIGRLSSQPLSMLSPLVLDVLRLGIYQLFFLDTVASYAAVHETVELVKKSSAKKKVEQKAVSFVNALLREAQRQQAKIQTWFSQKKTAEQIAVTLSHPLWLVQKWVKEVGLGQSIQICEANNEIAPLCLRVNPLKCNRETLLELFKKEMPDLDIHQTLCAPNGIFLFKAGSVRKLPGYTSGYFQVQDETSQLVALVVAPKAQEKILDACAAPGGKTTHLAELMKDQGEIFALDREKGKLRPILQNSERLGLTSIHPLHQDFLKWKPPVLFDRVLVDAPCSALGVLRRRPEAKWNRTLDQIKSLADLQLSLLLKADEVLKPQGVLVYSVCTFTPEETHEVVKKFLSQNPHFKLDSIKPYLPPACEPFLNSNGTMTILPFKNGIDGYFIARFIKT
ncbi:MAG: 16S rRNA (cytosine(967)-C(5))-methyltransferase RsmB [Deltaproteobacteria bacterium]|nr:16S rRNA (cytosine(967)-C(5))-methyltransferase RsmB [Deltaproteobacteria bacterium]